MNPLRTARCCRCGVVFTTRLPAQRYCCKEHARASKKEYSRESAARRRSGIRKREWNRDADDVCCKDGTCELCVKAADWRTWECMR